MQDNYIVHKESKILITGAAGYVGMKVLRTLLSLGYLNIKCLVRSSYKSGKIENLFKEYSTCKSEILVGNLLSKQDCQKAARDVEVIYHLAAGVEKSYAGCFLNSVIATRNLLDCAIFEGTLKRFVNISSIAVYSNEKIKRGGLIDESCEIDKKIIDRFEPYTYGKIKQDEIVVEYGEKYNIPYVIVRLSVVFGPGKVKISDRIGTDTFGIFLHLGLNNIIPLTYIDNCAEAIVLAGIKMNIDKQVFNIVDDNLPRSKEFLRLYKKNVASFISIPVFYPLWYFFNYLWEKYAKLSKGQLPPAFNRRSCATYWKGNSYSNNKAKELLEWKPRIGINEALELFFKYIKEMEIKR